LEEERSTKDTILLVLSIVFIELIIILSAFLLFRLSSKRIIRKQNLKAKRIQNKNDKNKRREQLRDRRTAWSAARHLEIPIGYMDN
jgi:Flp pilus assembly protein TadB